MTKLYDADIYINNMLQSIKVLSITPDFNNNKLIIQGRYADGKLCTVFLDKDESKGLLDRLQQSISALWG